MKKIILLICILHFGILFSQDIPKFNSSNSAGIFYYNTAEVIKKIKIKGSEDKNKTTKALRDYNGKIKKISFLNSFKLKELDVLVNRINKNPNNVSSDEKINTRKKFEDVLVPVADSIKKYEKTLNESLVLFLSKKQNKKWLKYQRRQKKDLLPKPKAAPQNPNQNAGGGFGNRRNRRF